MELTARDGDILEALVFDIGILNLGLVACKVILALEMPVAEAAFGKQTCATEFLTIPQIQARIIRVKRIVRHDTTAELDMRVMRLGFRLGCIGFALGEYTFGLQNIHQGCSGSLCTTGKGGDCQHSRDCHADNAEPNATLGAFLIFQATKAEDE